jgi:ABC-type branched-subunit amino acid transport system substrate-binding protein
VQTTYYMNSGINIASLTGELKEGARGIAIVQLMPAVTDAGASIALEYKKVAEGRPGTPVTPKGLEGYVSAKIFSEALRRAGKDLSREAFVRAMESLQSYDLGGVIANYSPTDHNGLTFVDLAVVSRSGGLLR